MNSGNSSSAMKVLSRMRPGQVNLLAGPFQHRFNLNRRYLLSLKNENLLQNHYFEAGLWGPAQKPQDCHWGWESPTSAIRGQFLGHWMSAAAHLWAYTGDNELKARADKIVSELQRCQAENGGEWIASIPEKTLHAIAAGRWRWAPHYVVHKTLMGLLDMATLAQNETAMEILCNFAKWFCRWTRSFSREQMDNILEVETGGMMEAWADLYALTGREEHLELVRRYERRRLVDRLLAGDDPLTNRHANTTIPEAHGFARAWEVTGEKRWRDATEAYWDCAVTTRGCYCTGGQTCGEVWGPPMNLAARLGDKTQEHCTVYNMMRLADYLLRWTGESAYADYWERNLYNGILAQQHPGTGMVSYFLPMQAGGKKRWGSPTDDFWCCHGSLVQAHTLYQRCIYFKTSDGLAVAQFIPSECTWERPEGQITIRQSFDEQLGDTQNLTVTKGQENRPQATVVVINIKAAVPSEFTLKLRIPVWITGKPVITVNGNMEKGDSSRGSFTSLVRRWADDTIRIEFPRELTTCPLPGEPDTVAFMDGPVVLAGLCTEGRTLYGDKERPSTMLAPDGEREWMTWRTRYRSVGQNTGLSFLPLHEIIDEPYTIYFPVQPSKASL